MEKKNIYIACKHKKIQLISQVIKENSVKIRQTFTINYQSLKHDKIPLKRVKDICKLAFWGGRAIRQKV